jgi:hypothetical protein
MPSRTRTARPGLGAGIRQTVAGPRHAGVEFGQGVTRSFSCSRFTQSVRRKQAPATAESRGYVRGRL